MAQVIVPTTTRGVRIVRRIGVWGLPESDHCKVVYEDVRVPLENILGQVGDGHRAAQDRLGAGRIYHCMNSVGQMWRAFNPRVQRAWTRQVHGGPLKDKQFVQGFIADSYQDIQAARLRTIHAAERIDRDDVDARTDISPSRCSCRPPTSGWSTEHPGLGGRRHHQRTPARPHVPGGSHPPASPVADGR